MAKDNETIYQPTEEVRRRIREALGCSQETSLEEFFFAIYSKGYVDGLKKGREETYAPKEKEARA
jgi:hypothetical protein